MSSAGGPIPFYRAIGHSFSRICHMTNHRWETPSHSLYLESSRKNLPIVLFWEFCLLLRHDPFNWFPAATIARYLHKCAFDLHVMRLQYFLYDRFRIAYLLGVEVKHIILETGLREITGGQSSNEDQGHSSAKVVSSPLVDKGACVPRWTSAGVHWAFLVFVWSATWYTAGCPPPPRSGCPARCRPCFLRSISSYRCW